MTLDWNEITPPASNSEPKKIILINSILQYLEKKIFPVIFAANLRQKARQAGSTVSYSL